MTLRIDNVVTSGIFTLDGEDFAVDNNIWLVGDGDEVIVQSTIELAHNLGLTCVAEGVQDGVTLERLARL